MDKCKDCKRPNTRGTLTEPAGCLKFRWPNDTNVLLDCAIATIARLRKELKPHEDYMAALAEQELVSPKPIVYTSPYECQCREPALYGSLPADPDCKAPGCKGTGYTTDIAFKKDWSKYTTEQLDGFS